MALNLKKRGEMDNILPKISIITPSFNQGQFLEETILSVLSQNYPNLEYIIIDGGSSDNSIEIIRKYEDKLAYWVSEPDNGQYDAINKGFSVSTGEIMAWINSDDKYVSWSFQTVSNIFVNIPEMEWITTLCPILWNQFGVPISCTFRREYTRREFMKGGNLPSQSIQQESVFWRRSLWERAGGYVDLSYNLAGDFELWTRFYQYANLYTVNLPLGGFRFHGNQKSVIYYEKYCEEARNILIKYGGRPPNKVESLLRAFLNNYVVLPHKIRHLMVKLNLKDCNNLCVYSIENNSWEVKKI
jgi:glycosyltransferase involved in cell wall biosynthesis